MSKVKSIYIKSQQLEDITIMGSALHIYPKNKNFIAVPFRYLSQIIFIGIPSISANILTACSKQKVLITFMDERGNTISNLSPTTTAKNKEYNFFEQEVWPESLHNAYKAWFDEQKNRIFKESFYFLRKKSNAEQWINKKGRQQHYSEWPEIRNWVSGFLKASIYNNITTTINIKKNQVLLDDLSADLHNLLLLVLLKKWLKQPPTKTADDRIIANYFFIHCEWINLQINRLLYALLLQQKNWEDEYASRFIG